MALVDKLCQEESRALHFNGLVSCPHSCPSPRKYFYLYRYMWNNGQYLLFRHIADMFQNYQEYALHRLPKLTLDHILLTCYSKMKVKLAVKVLSRTVSTCLLESDDPSVVGTAMFCRVRLTC